VNNYTYQEGHIERSFSPGSPGSPEEGIRLSNAIGSNMPVLNGSAVNFSQASDVDMRGSVIGSQTSPKVSIGGI